VGAAAIDARAPAQSSRTQKSRVTGAEKTAHGDHASSAGLAGTTDSQQVRCAETLCARLRAQRAMRLIREIFMKLPIRSARGGQVRGGPVFDPNAETAWISRDPKNINPNASPPRVWPPCVSSFRCSRRWWTPWGHPLREQPPRDHPRDHRSAPRARLLRSETSARGAGPWRVGAGPDRAASRET
jgi:hypothetical protein